MNETTEKCSQARYARTIKKSGNISDKIRQCAFTKYFCRKVVFEYKQFHWKLIYHIIWKLLNLRIQVLSQYCFIACFAKICMNEWPSQYFLTSALLYNLHEWQNVKKHSRICTDKGLTNATLANFKSLLL